MQTSGQAQVNWANITSTPATFPPAVHNHDTSYYTKAQVDATLAAITYTTISANDINTNVTGAELEILTNGSDAVGLHTHSDLSTQLNAIGLQQAYNIGQTINASKADISIQASAGYAPLALKTITYVPTLSLAGGEICYYDNEMFYYDSSRATWLSMASHSIHGTNSGSNLKNVYLTVGSSTMSANSGWVFPWMGTIMSMEMTSDGVSPTTTMAIYKNGVSVYTLAWNTTMKSYQYNINIEFVAGDVLAFYAVTGSTGPTRPIVNVQIKRRLN